MESMESHVNLEIGGKLREWPSMDEYRELKTKSFAEHWPVLRYMIKNNLFFSDLSDGQIDEVSELFTHFVFGVEMAYRRFGLTRQDMPIKFEPVGPTSLTPFGLEPNLITGKSKYVFYIAGIKEMLKEAPTGRLFGHKMGGMIEPTLKDIFEVGAVEEAAHFLFVSTKKTDGGSQMIIGDIDHTVNHHIPDVERRALLWKIQYVERYKPEYVDDLRNLQRRVVEIRSHKGL